MASQVNNETGNTPPRPIVLLICLEEKEMFDDLYKGLID